MAYKGLKIQVGDLVKCVNANGVIGLVVELRRGAMLCVIRVQDPLRGGFQRGDPWRTLLPGACALD